MRGQALPLLAERFENVCILLLNETSAIEVL